MTGIGGILVIMLTALLTAVDAPVETIEWVTGVLVALLGTYNIGQGLADFGKEAMKE